MLHDDSLRYYFSHQVLRPSRLVHPIPSRSYVISQLYIALWILGNRLHRFNIFANCTRVPYFQKIWLEHHISRMRHEHVHVWTSHGHHIVMVTENLTPVACPDVLPDVFGICTDAIHKPLRVVVQGDLGILTSSFFFEDDKKLTSTR